MKYVENMDCLYLNAMQQCDILKPKKGLIEKGKSSWKDEIRDAIEQSQATNFEELERELNQLDITIDRVTNKTITYRHLKENKK